MHGPGDEDVSEAMPQLGRRDLARLALAATACGVLPEAALVNARPIKAGVTHTLPSTNQTVRSGAFDPTAPSALKVRSGDIVYYPNTWLHWGNQPKYGMSYADREAIRKPYKTGPFSLVGPVEIEGAEPGDVVECRMIRLRPIDWGWNSTPPRSGAIPEDFSAPYLHYFRFDAERRTTELAPGIKLQLSPFQAVLAAQPVGDKPVSAILTGDYGGNLLIPQLTVGSSLFLPVQVSGARMWTGDSHAVQGDGVVNQTAIETAMEDLRIQYILHRKVALAGPLVETATHWIVLGYGQSLEEALTMALRRTIAWLSKATGLAPQDAYALASLSGSFRVTQYARQLESNYTSAPAKAVQAMIPRSIFAPAMAARVAAILRNSAA